MTEIKLTKRYPNSRITDAYMRGWNDALDAVQNGKFHIADTPQANEIGDCNICRFAGCSECDDCINGSEWVRMVDYLEDVDDEQTDCQWK